MIKLNGLGHVGGCGCGTCMSCRVPSQLSGLGGPLPNTYMPQNVGMPGTPRSDTPVKHLAYGQYQQGGNANWQGTGTASGSNTSFLDSLATGGYQPPPDLWRDASGGPSPGMNSRTQQQEAWERGNTIKQTYTDVLNGNMDKVGAKAAQTKALDRAAKEVDPLARARALEDARAYGDEATRLSAGGPMRPGVPVKRTVQWEEVSSGGYAEIQQREMERRGIKTYRPPGWKPDEETRRLQIKKKAEARALADKLAKQKLEQQRRREDQERINRERAAALRARADTEKARQVKARAEREAAEKAARAAQRAAAEREARALRVLEEAEKNAVRVALTPRVQQARQAVQAKPARAGANPGVDRWGKGAYGLMGLRGPNEGVVALAGIGALQLAVLAGAGYLLWSYEKEWSKDFNKRARRQKRRESYDDKTRRFLGDRGLL